MNVIAELVRQGLNERLPPLIKAAASAPRPACGWLHAVREAIGMRQGTVAKAMGVKRQSYARLEKSEAKYSISLSSLQKAANAMDCDVVYFLVPRAAVAANYTELARKHDPRLRHLHAAEHSMAVEGQAVGDQNPKP